MKLQQLTAIIRAAEFRRHSLEALRLLFEQYPQDAETTIKSILADTSVSMRARTFVVYYLREFGLLPGLVKSYEPALQAMVDAVARDIEQDDEEGVLDPFSNKDFPHG